MTPNLKHISEKLDEILRRLPAATQEQPAGSGARHKRDLSGHDLCPICGHSHSEWGAAVAAMHESPSTFGSPRKVGEDGHTDGLSWRCIGLVLSREHRDLIVQELRAKYPSYGAGYTLSYPATLDVVSAVFRELEELCSEKVRAAARPSSVPVGEQK